MKSDRDYRPILLFAAILIIILFIGLFTPVRGTLAFHIDQLKSRVYYMVNPPGEDIFVPQEAQLTPLAEPTLEPSPTATELPPTEQPAEVAPLATATELVTVVPVHTAQPSATPVPLPPSAALTGVKYEDQHGIWNYCAPTNLSMALTYWGWDGDRLKAGSWLKPFEKDKNVMFYEMQNFVTEMTGLRSIVRRGGSAELLKRLIVAGFPVLIEKGSFMQEVNGNLSWMGHYNLVTGYDDATQKWIVQDSYYTRDYKIDYEKLLWEWKCFNFEFMVVYPGDREAELYNVLGPLTNEEWSKQNAFDIAEQQVKDATDDESYFYAYFNRGSAQVDLNDFYGAAQSYDMAFQYYANLDQKIRPYRIVWYQTGPYYAYYYSGRYQDLISLADISIASTKEPYIEETYYWRAMAYRALGEFPKAETDLRTCLEIHPEFTACTNLLAEMGM